MKPREGHHVDRELPEISVELTGEPEAGGHAGHGQGDQMVQVTVGRGRQLQGSKYCKISRFIYESASYIFK